MSRIKNPFSMYLNSTPTTSSYDLRGTKINVVKEMDDARDTENINDLYILAMGAYDAIAK